MEWPQELLDLFEDPLLEDARPKEARLTADDRKVKKLGEITEWCEAHGGRTPERDGKDMTEKLLARSLRALRRDAGASLSAYDRLHLLKEQ